VKPNDPFGGIFGPSSEHSVLGDAPLPHPEERRVTFACDEPGCAAYRDSIDGRAQNHPADEFTGAPASWTTDVWFHVRGKDYCPLHGAGRLNESLSPVTPEALAAAENVSGVRRSYEAESEAVAAQTPMPTHSPDPGLPIALKMAAWASLTVVVLVICWELWR